MPSDRKSTRLNSSHGSISYAVSLDRKSTRLNSSLGSISYAVSLDRKSTRLNSSHGSISYAVFCLKKKNKPLNSTEGHTADRVGSLARMLDRHDQRSPHYTCCVARTYLLPFSFCFFFFFFNDTATTEIYPLSLHDALPI